LASAPDRLSPSERSIRASIAANEKWAHADPVEGTAKARAKFLASFLDEVDPDRKLPEAERLRRAESARKAFYTRLAFLSAKARRRRKSVDATNAGPNNRRSSKSELPSDVSRA
jgi:hypothetical protein